METDDKDGQDKTIPIASDVKDGVTKGVKGVGRILGEFKDFAIRGNMMDTAVGIVIGSAFTTLVHSIVNNLIMPFVTYFTAGVKFEQLEWNGIAYGQTISALITFIIVAAVVFVMVKAINALRRISPVKSEEEEAEETATEVEVLKEIKELLIKQQETSK